MILKPWNRSRDGGQFADRWAPQVLRRGIFPSAYRYSAGPDPPVLTGIAPNSATPSSQA